MANPQEQQKQWGRIIAKAWSVFHLVLPAKPAGKDLSDEDLAKVAGGKVVGSTGPGDLMCI